MDEDNYYPSAQLRIVGATSMLLTGIVGLFLNILITYTLFGRFKLNSGFLMICMVKAMSNIIICAGVCLWPVPIAYFNYPSPPRFYNVLAGQLIGWFAWSYSPTTQILLAGNRLAAVYHPHEYHAKYKYSPNRIFLSIIFVLSVICTIPGFFDGCNFVFELKYFSWAPDDGLCAARLSAVFTYSAFGMSFISNTFNIVVFLKLVADAKLAKISSVEHLNRQRRNRRMLFQSFCQDLIIAVDTFNTTYAWMFYDALWFQFIVGSYSKVLARTLEGLVMVLVNETIHESIRKKIYGDKKKLRRFSSPPASSTILSHTKNIITSNRIISSRFKY